jgi:hypothetical protein
MAGFFLPMAGIFGWAILGKRRRLGSMWGVLIFLCLTGATLLATGCGGFTQKSAAPGTYIIQVIGVGQTTNVSSSQNVTLTITR